MATEVGVPASTVKPILEGVGKRVEIIRKG